MDLTNAQLAELILTKLGRPKSLVEFVADRPGHDRRYALNSSKIRSQLGWKPKWKFPDALERTIEWYRSNEAWWKPLLEYA